MVSTPELSAEILSAPGGPALSDNLYESLPPPPFMVSLLVPPSILSLPSLAEILSLPAKPFMVSALVVPVIVSAAEVPLHTVPTTHVLVAANATPQPTPALRPPL